MKKVKFVSGSKYKYHYYKWQFTDDEKNEIRGILKICKKDVPEKKIKNFIVYLQSLCELKKTLILDQPSRDNVRSAREVIIKDCKIALNHLRRSCGGKVSITHSETLDFFLNNKAEDNESDFLVNLMDSAALVILPLEKFINVIEKYHKEEKKKIGRKNVDSDKFIEKIRDIYIEHIGKPTTYENGAFFRIVQLALEILDLPSSDPSRAIKASLKK